MGRPRIVVFDEDKTHVKFGRHWYRIGRPGPIEQKDSNGVYIKTCYHGDRGERHMYTRVKSVNAYRNRCLQCGAIWYDFFDKERKV